MRLALSSGSMSRTNTNVRAGAISFEKSSTLSRVANWLLMNFELKEHMAVRLNSSSGKIVMHEPLSSSFTSIFFLITYQSFGAFSSSMPTSLILSMYIAALPSRMGNSGPLTCMRQLSMPSA